MIEFNQRLEEMLKDEKEYLIENKFEMNEHGVFIYQTPFGNHIISLDSILNDYKRWLIGKNIVKYIQTIETLPTLFAHTFSNMCRWESVFNNMQQLPPEMRAWVCRVDEYKIAAGMYQGEQCVGFYFGPEMYPYFKEFALELDQLPEGFEKTIEEKIKLLTVALEG